MSDTVWKYRVDTALERLQRDRWTTPAVRYMEVIDDVAAGDRSVDEIARRHGSYDLVVSALRHVTVTVHGGDAVPTLEQGGWCERDGERYRVAPDFAAEWMAARSAQRSLQALQAL